MFRYVLLAGSLFLTGGASLYKRNKQVFNILPKEGHSLIHLWSGFMIFLFKV